MDITNYIFCKKTLQNEHTNAYNPSLSDCYCILWYLYYYSILFYTMITMCIRIEFHERSGQRKIHMPKISILAQCCCVRFTRGSDVSKYMGCFGNVSRTDVCIHMIYFCWKWLHVLCIYIYIYIVYNICVHWTDKLQNDFGEYYYIFTICDVMNASWQFSLSTLFRSRG